MRSIVAAIARKAAKGLLVLLALVHTPTDAPPLLTAPTTLDALDRVDEIRARLLNDSQQNHEIMQQAQWWPNWPNWGNWRNW
jgi:hypothetical protein